MLSTKLAAFTIIELLTVLFLSSLIFGAILLVFQITQQQQQQQTKDYNEVLAIERAKVLLQQDAYNSSSLFRANKSLQCFYPTHQIEYQFGANYLLRTIKHDIEQYTVCQSLFLLILIILLPRNKRQFLKGHFGIL
jgi:hypothetical protein